MSALLNKTSFTDEEKALYEDYCGFVIPFCTNKGYTVTDNTEDGAGILFKLKHNLSEREAEQYLLNFLDQTKFESKGYTPYDGKGAIYKFAKGGYTILVTFEAPNYSVYYLSVQIVEGDLDFPAYLYTDFKAGEKEIYQNAFGFVIPFAPNNYYSVDDFSATGGIKYLYFGALLNTEEEVNAYLALFSQENGYVLDEDMPNGTSGSSTNYYFVKDGVSVQVAISKISTKYSVIVHTKA